MFPSGGSFISKSEDFVLIHPRSEHFHQIQELCKRVYPFSKPWSIAQLESHQAYFPDGQWIVIDKSKNQVVGLAFSLIVLWDDYSPQDNWLDLTSAGYFRNHNPKKGKTLYGAEVMVDPGYRGQGIGRMLYEGRKKIVQDYGLKRIRAGARLRGYSKFQNQLSPEEYVRKVVEAEIYDPTLSFQLGQGFRVIDVAANYLFNDPESLGFAAVIEWLNPELTTTRDLQRQALGIELFLSNSKFTPQFLPKELRRLVRKTTLCLGQIILEYEGEALYRRIESYRDQLKKTRKKRDKELLQKMLANLKKESAADQFRIAHAFALQLELVNACEAAYRTWKQRQTFFIQGASKKSDLIYVLTAHPTEARSSNILIILNQLQQILLDGFHNNFVFQAEAMARLMRMLWLQPLAKQKKPSVEDEAEYVSSLVFREDIMDFILADKPAYHLRLRTWVGGDKDGHPGVDALVMLQCLEVSRHHILDYLSSKLDLLISDMRLIQGTLPKHKDDPLIFVRLKESLSSLKKIGDSDGNKILAWKIKFRSHVRKASSFVKKHDQIRIIERLLEIFPGFVLPIEVREDAGKIAENVKNRSGVLWEMIRTLKAVSGSLPLTSYVRGLVISHCESVEDLDLALKFLESNSKVRNLPVVPLFESREALIAGPKILKEWLSKRSVLKLVQQNWKKQLEVMLGYSDSSKQIGVLPSRSLIFRSMFQLEKEIKKKRLVPVFFHGSGGSVARGGGSFKEQISWWSQSAINYPKMTIQGEMIQRLFATKEILNSQCLHMSNESLKRRINPLHLQKSSAFEKFVTTVEAEYRNLFGNPDKLKPILDSTLYSYLDVLKIGSRPSKRPAGNVSIESLRAIPWNLCWTQSRSLLPTWWGIGRAFGALETIEKNELAALFEKSPFFSSFVKTLGFTLAKVELDIWELAFGGKQDSNFFEQFRKEFDLAKKFVFEVSGQKQLIWYRPWLEESIRLRSPNIHILNLLQLLAIENENESLLRESIVGISCGMLTTG